MSKNSNGGGMGCIGIILTIMIVWALLFGVTWKGVHYGISCSEKEGLKLSP